MSFYFSGHLQLLYLLRRSYFNQVAPPGGQPEACGSAGNSRAGQKMCTGQFQSVHFDRRTESPARRFGLLSGGHQRERSLRADASDNGTEQLENQDSEAADGPLHGGHQNQHA